MAIKLVWTPQAEEDLIAIYSYIAPKVPQRLIVFSPSCRPAWKHWLEIRESFSADQTFGRLPVFSSNGLIWFFTKSTPTQITVRCEKLKSSESPTDGAT